MSNPLIFIASDHRGFKLKAKFVDWLEGHGFNVRDLGPQSEARCDAQAYAQKVAEVMRENPGAMGVLICGTGQAMSMTANRYRYIRAALVTNTTMARLARQHNDANVLALGAGLIGEEIAFECLETFLKTEPLGGHYAERVKQLEAMGGL
jgi:ribose 5-phosphate isomerase B